MEKDDSTKEEHVTPQEERTVEQKSESNHYAQDLYSLYAIGLLAAILVLLQGFLALPNFDTWIIISMLASAVAIPPLSGVLVVSFVEKRFPYAHPRSASSRVVNVASAIGFLAALTAVTAAFGHVSWIVMVVFVVSLLSTGAIYGWYVSHLDDKP